MTQDERRYMEEKFSGFASLMNAHFENVEDRLDRIEEQTKKTNGRVSELEKSDLTHFSRCPQTAKIELINKELEEYRMMKKYPKLFIAGVVIVVLLSLATFLTNNPLKVFDKSPQQIEYVQK